MTTTWIFYFGDSEDKTEVNANILMLMSYLAIARLLPNDFNGNAKQWSKKVNQQASEIYAKLRMQQPVEIRDNQNKLILGCNFGNGSLQTEYSPKSFKQLVARLPKNIGMEFTSKVDYQNSLLEVASNLKMKKNRELPADYEFLKTGEVTIVALDTKAEVKDNEGGVL